MAEKCEQETEQGKYIYIGIYRTQQTGVLNSTRHIFKTCGKIRQT